MFWGWTDFKKRENIIRDDLDENATLTIAVDITIGTPQRQLKETMRLLMLLERLRRAKIWT